MLMTLSLLLAFFFFALEFDEDVFGDSDDKGSGLGFTSGSCLSSFFELSVDHVSGLLFNVVTKYVCSVCGIFSVSCSKTSLVSSSELFIRYAVILLIFQNHVYTPAWYPCLYLSVS